MTIQPDKDAPPMGPANPGIADIAVLMEQAGAAISALQQVAYGGPRENPQEIEVARSILDRLRVMIGPPPKRERRR